MPCPAPPQSSKTALHEAAFSGHAEVVAELLRKGVDHDLALPVSGGRHEGARGLSWGCVGLMPAQCWGRQCLAMVCRVRSRTLQCAAKHGHVQFVTLPVATLFEAAWCCVLRTSLQKTGLRALHLAALKGSQPVVQALLLGGANVDARAKVGFFFCALPSAMIKPTRAQRNT